MKLLVLGIDHRSAPTAVRERLAFEGETLSLGLAELKRHFPACEHLVLSTCNRVEIYLGSPSTEPLPATAALLDWLARHHQIDREAILPHAIEHQDEAAVRHLFRVASSLESLVLGEGQILGQVRDAYRAAVAGESVGPLFHGLFQSALRVGKRVRETTGLDQGRLSIASIAVEVAQSVFESFREKVVLVIGAGKMSDLTLRHLSELRPGRVVICNRGFDRAQEAAARWRAEAVPFDRLHDALAEADLVISTTAAEQPIVTYEAYGRIQRKARAGRLALILDLAVPRDFEPRIGDLDQVLLYNVDDLRTQVERNLKQRQAQIEPAHEIIERETAEFVAAARHQREAGALLRQLGDYGDDLAAQELQKFFAACPDLSDRQRLAAEHLVHRVKNQFLHHPRTALRQSLESQPPSAHGDAHPLLTAVRQIFGLAAAPPRAHNRDST